MNINQEYLKSILNYDKESGIFLWNITKGRACVGIVAGGLTKDGYIRISIAGKKYLAHRLAWIYINRIIDKEYIDHINGIKNDNRIVNLRESTNKENQINRNIQVNNTSGFRGVCYNKQNDTYVASTTRNGIKIYLGSFCTAELASIKYESYSKLNDGIFYKSMG